VRFLLPAEWTGFIFLLSAFDSTIAQQVMAPASSCFLNSFFPSSRHSGAARFPVLTRLGLLARFPLPLCVLRVAEHPARLRVKAPVFRPVCCSGLKLAWTSCRCLVLASGLWADFVAVAVFFVRD
jgi:hypothetical protein